MDHLATVRGIAVELGLLADGKLVPLDSLSLISFIVRIEAAVGFDLPVERIDTTAFDSLEGVAAVVSAAAAIVPPT